MQIDPDELFARWSGELDAAAVFRNRRHFVTAHDDPDRGAHAVFDRCAGAGRA